MSLALQMFVVAFFEEENVFHFKFQNGSDNSPAVSLLGDKRSIKIVELFIKRNKNVWGVPKRKISFKVSDVRRLLQKTLVITYFFVWKFIKHGPFLWMIVMDERNTSWSNNLSEFN